MRDAGIDGPSCRGTTCCTRARCRRPQSRGDARAPRRVPRQLRLGMRATRSRAARGSAMAHWTEALGDAACAPAPGRRDRALVRARSLRPAAAACRFSIACRSTARRASRRSPTTNISGTCRRRAFRDSSRAARRDVRRAARRARRLDGVPLAGSARDRRRAAARHRPAPSRRRRCGAISSSFRRSTNGLSRTEQQALEAVADGITRRSRRVRPVASQPRGRVLHGRRAFLVHVGALAAAAPPAAASARRRAVSRD